MNRLIFVLVMLAAGLLILVLNHGNDEIFGMDSDQFGRLVSLLPFATVLGAGILISRRHTLARSLRDLAAWAVIILGLIVLWLYRDDFSTLGDRVLAALVPGRAVVSQSAEGGSEGILHKSI